MAKRSKLDEGAREFFRQHGRKGGKKRWKDVSVEKRTETGSRLAQSYWDSLTPEERSAEMKRRAEVRAENRAAKEGAKSAAKGSGKRKGKG